VGTIFPGIGVETIAHLRENGRICIMFCAFSRRPRIVRLHGQGRVVLPGDPLADDVLARHPAHAGTRAVIVVQVSRVSDSCGYGVPVMDLVGERDLLALGAAKRGPDRGAVSPYLLGVDLGTASSKAVLGTPDGVIVATANRPHAMSLPRPGWAEVDAEKAWWGDVTGWGGHGVGRWRSFMASASAGVGAPPPTCAGSHHAPAGGCSA